MGLAGSPARDIGPPSPDDEVLTAAAVIEIWLEPTTLSLPLTGRTVTVVLEVTVRPAWRRAWRRNKDK
jgi:hypothetical protein